MISYLGTGERYYGDSPLKISERQSWEFQVVLKGRIGPVIPGGGAGLKTRTMWVFPNKFPHGWCGRPGCRAEVAVFHYKEVPKMLHDSLPAEGFYERALDATACRRIGMLAEKARVALMCPNNFSYLRHQHILFELSLFLEGERPVPSVASSQITPSHQVYRAMEWYRGHIGECPSLDDVGKAVGVSSSHLRRLFHRFAGCHPQEIFHQIKFQIAQELMGDPAWKLEAIAERCGFGSASSFSRAFKIRHGYCPAEWRRGLSQVPSAY